MTVVPGEPLDGAPTPAQLDALAAAITALWSVLHDALPAGRPGDDLEFARVLTAAARPAGGVAAAAHDAALSWRDGPDPALLRTAPERTVLGHRDPSLANYLWDGYRIRIVDFEDAAVSDPATELAILTEHLSARRLDADEFCGRFDVDPVRLRAARRVWAMFWLWLLRPGGPSEGAILRVPPTPRPGGYWRCWTVEPVVHRYPRHPQFGGSGLAGTAWCGHAASHGRTTPGGSVFRHHRGSCGHAGRCRGGVCCSAVPAVRPGAGARAGRCIPVAAGRAATGDTTVPAAATAVAARAPRRRPGRYPRRDGVRGRPRHRRICGLRRRYRCRQHRPRRWAADDLRARHAHCPQRTVGGRRATDRHAGCGASGLPGCRVPALGPASRHGVPGPVAAAGFRPRPVAAAQRSRCGNPSASRSYSSGRL